MSDRLAEADAIGEAIGISLFSRRGLPLDACHGRAQGVAGEGHAVARQILLVAGIFEAACSNRQTAVQALHLHCRREGRRVNLVVQGVDRKMAQTAAADGDIADIEADRGFTKGQRQRGGFVGQ